MKGKYPAFCYSHPKIFVLSIIGLFAFSLCALWLRSPAVTAQTKEFSPAALGYIENFDGVNAPQLPSNWTTSVTGTQNLPFVTTINTPDTPPNAVFTNDPATVGSSEIVSPVIRIGSNSPKLIFRNKYDAETNFDGGVLEIKIGNGAFQDILAAGGSFVNGAYNGIISSGFMNPLAARQAWTGFSNGFVTTEVNLPASSFRQLVQFKWRFGSDNSDADVGWWIDNVQITNVVTGENSTAITLPNVGAASPYPSEIQVADLTGKVTNVVVNVENFSHTSPDDVDLLLVSPSGRNVVLMSDVGGGNPVNNLSITFDDAATNSLPDSAALISGTFKPTDFETGDAFPAPAPPGTPTGTKLGAFFNDEPNGAWKLFAVDDSGGNAGNITGGWSIIVDSSATAISIPDSGMSEPYPSGIVVSGQIDLVSKVTVSLTSFNHTAPDDVDLMLVAPDGRKVVLMSDAGGNSAANNLSLTFDDAAAANLPDNTQLTSGTYKPTDFEIGDIFPATPSGALTGTRLSAFNGAEANGTWQLFLVDDNGNNAGTINAWSLNLQTAPGVVAIPASGAAQPYPADKLITGLSGNVTKATVTLSNFSHSSPDDVDIMLVAPNGRRIVLMSDAGGTTEVGNLNLTFDDTATLNLPDNSVLTSGTYKPTDFEIGDAFPAPAPQGGVTGTTLNAFYGSAPNGTWKLFVVDDNGENLGSIAGSWNLTLETSTNACLFSISPTVQVFPVTGGGGSFNITMPTGCSWSASANLSFIGITSSASGDGNGTINFSVAPNMTGGREGFIDVSNGVIIKSFQIQQPSGCPFSLNGTILNFNSNGGSGNVAVTAGNACNWQATTSASWIQINSMPHTGNGTLGVSVQPNTSGIERSATVTIGARSITVNQSSTAPSRQFDFDGDSKADISIYRPSAGEWWYLRSSDGGNAVFQFGNSSDKIAPADFTGDGKTDIAFFRPSTGEWFILRSEDFSYYSFPFGTSGDVPAPGDYDNDGKADAAVFRPSTFTWFINKSSGGTIIQSFGQSGDVPAVSDYDGDSKADIAIYRPTAGEWWIQKSSDSSVVVFQFGNSSDKPVQGDYTGDDKADVAIFRPSTGEWFILRSEDGTYYSFPFGASGDIPAPADFDGDGRFDATVFRPSQSTWYVQRTTAGTLIQSFGQTGVMPVPSAFINQ
ncbi:MAG: proprotein convertase P-domain-containing protein [Pyrinomonadaceae bacterium]